MNKLLFNRGRRTRNREFIGMMLVIMNCLMAFSCALGSVAYLPSVGPAPLRFEAAATGLFLAWKPLLIPAKQLAQDPDAPAMTTKALDNDTNAAVLMAISSPIMNTNPPVNPTAVLATSQGEKIDPAPVPTQVFFGTQPDISSVPVTAQILAEYFKPGPGGGNNRMGTAVFVPVGVSSSPTPPAPANTSKAVYKTE